VVVRYRAILFCTMGTACTSESMFTSIDLVPLGLDGEAACARNASTLAVVVSDTGSMGQLYEWNGTTFTRTQTSLGVRYPRSCWYDTAGRLHVAGENKIVVYEQSAALPETLVNSGSVTFSGGFSDQTASWAVGTSGNVHRRVGSAWAPLVTNTTNTMSAVGGPTPDEIYVFGFWGPAYGNGFKWNGSTLTGTGNLLPSATSQSSMRVIRVTGPNELYVGGGTPSGPLIFRGRR